jgi:hypothetical protein
MRWIALAVALAAAGCGPDQPGPMAAAGPGATIAFDSIDGPPRPVFDNLVASLTAEAAARQISVVSRDARAAYRVRGYLAAQVERRRVRIAWVWDIYDAERRRAFRVSGEEPAARPRKDAWAAADAAMTQRIARASLDQFVAFLGGTTPPQEPQEPGADAAMAMAVRASAR